MEAEAEASLPHAFQRKLAGWMYEMWEQYGLTMYSLNGEDS